MLFLLWDHLVNIIKILFIDLIFVFLETNDIQQLLRLIDPTSFGLENDKHFR